MSQNKLLKLTQSDKNVSMRDNDDLPDCYYHKNAKIYYFCLDKECTVPLCDDCKRIHTRDGKIHHIIKYQIAKKQALQLLNKQQILFQNMINSIKDQLKYQRQQLIKQIDTYFYQIKQNLGIKQKQNILKQIHQQHTVINSGKIKPLIQFYIHQKPIIKLTHYHTFIHKQLIKNIFQIQQKEINFNISQTRKSEYSTEKKCHIKIKKQDQKLENKAIESRSSSYDKKKRKGLSMIYNSQKNLQKIKHFTPLKRYINQVESWKKVVKMSPANSNSTSRLIISRINNHKQYQNLISPTQLMQYCQNKQRYLQNQKIKLKKNQSQNYITNDDKLIYKQGFNDRNQEIKQFIV